jgi:Zn-dependent protease
MTLQNIAFWIVIILFTVTLHEVAHGFVAFLRGDDTAYRQGRLTLNPLKHIDPFWTIMFPAFLFFSTGGRFAIGMAKPVPVDFSKLKSPRSDMILVALAGPFANLILASLLTVLFKLTNFEPLLYAVYFNLGLMVFNLLPIPPLDGSRVLTALLPYEAAKLYMKVERFGFLIILALYFLGVLWSFVIPGMNFFAGLLDVPKLRFG